MKNNNFITKYRDKLKGNVFFQNIAVVTGGNVTAKAIGMLSAPIITRLYTPSDYGVFAVFISIVGIAGSLSTLRYAVTIPLAKEEKLADNLLKLCFLITFCLSLFFFVVIALTGKYLAIKFSVEQLKPYLWLMPVVFFGKGIYDALNNWAVRTKNFKLITKTRISQSVSSSAIKIGFGAVGLTPIGLFIGQIALDYTGIGSLFSKLLKVRPVFLKEFSWNGIKHVAKRYKKFPLVQSWSQLLLALGAQLPILLIGNFYGAKVVGLFGFAIGMVSLPMALIGQAVGQVYFAEISNYSKTNPEKIYELSISIMKKMFLIGLFPLGIIMLLGPWLFGFIFGNQWIDAGKYAQILSFLVLLRFISNPIMTVLNVLEKQGLQFFINLIRIILIIIIFYLSDKISLSTINAIVFYSIGISLFYLFVIIKIFTFLKMKK